MYNLTLRVCIALVLQNLHNSKADRFEDFKGGKPIEHSENVNYCAILPV